MSKPKILYIWEGTNDVTITRGFPFELHGKNQELIRLKVKHRNPFSAWQIVRNIDKRFITKSKRWYDGSSVRDGWEVYRIMYDFKTLEVCNAELSPAILNKIDTLKNEVEVWKSKYHSEKNMNTSKDNTNKFRDAEKKRMKTLQELKSMVYSDGGFSSPFYNRFGLGGSYSGGENQ